MSLQTQINTVDCSASGVKGTGLAGCKVDRKLVTAIGLLEKGTKFTEEITKEYLRTLQTEGKLIMLQDVVSFTDNTADDNIITRAGSGIKVVAGKNPYEYAVEFDNGINFHQALTSLSGYKAYDLILFDVDYTMFFTLTKSGEAKGFTLGMFENGKYMGSNGSDASSQIVTLQLTERMEVDERMSWITTNKLDFSSSELTGVNQVNLKANPIVAGTSIVVSAMLLDGTHAVEGLLFGDFKVTKNGALSSPTVAVYDANTKKYTLTVPAMVATDIITVSINGIVLIAGSDLFQSNTDTLVVS